VLDIVGPISRADLGMEHSKKCREVDTWWQPPFLYAIYFLLKRHAAWWVIYAPFAGGMASVFENVGARIRAHGTLVSSPAAKENNYALKSLDGYIVWACWELKRKFRVKCS